MKSFQYPFIVIFLLMLSIFSATVSFAQVPANNECSAATSLTSATTCTNVSGTLDNSTYNPSTMPATGCGATNKRDVWYKFVAQAPTQDIDISNGPSQMRIQLFSGTCGSFTSIFCGNGSLTATGLTVGTTYYIRVYRQNDGQGDFDICVTHLPPANDNCTGAISLTSNVSCVNTAGSLNTATASTGIPIGCFAAGTYYDVWYSFVAATTTETVTLSGLGANITNPRMQMYSGTCGSLTSLTCGTTSVTRSGLTVGTIYYVRVANLNSNPSGAGTVANFNICVTHVPPANDQCAGAVSLTSATSCVTTNGTVAGATNTAGTVPSGCTASTSTDVWYSFVAVSTTHTITSVATTNRQRIQLFSGPCGSLGCMDDGTGTTTSTITETGLTIGTTYYVRVYSSNGTPFNFDICVTHPPPVNDDCAGAISLTSNTTCVNTAGTLKFSTVNGGTPLGCFGVGNYYDVWYSFVAATATETVTISGLGANITNPRIQMYTNSCTALGGAFCGTTTITQTGLTVGTTYKIRVSNLNADPSGAGTVADFNICVTHVPPTNDQCAGATSLTSGTTCVTTGGTLNGASYTTIPTIGCGIANRNDVWYSFVAVSATTTITLSSYPANSRIQVFSGTCASLTSLACGNAPSLSATGLTVGNTYFVRIYTDPNVTGTFNICVTHAPPANDDCAGAISLTSGTACINTSGTLNLATANGATALGCFNLFPGNYYDVWYSFVALAATETVTLSSLGANITAPRIQMYTNACTALGGAICGTTTITQTGLTVGTTYKIRVSNFNANPSGAGTAASFNICVTHAGLANDLCAGAISVQSYPAPTCNTTSGTTVGSTPTTPSLGCGGSNIDVWYSFVAQSTNPTITGAGSGVNAGRFRLELFSGNCGSLTSMDCDAAILSGFAALTIGSTYYVRVYSTNASTFPFTFCITDPVPANDDCTGAISLTSDSSCNNTSGTLNIATASGGVPLGCFAAGTYYDVWYSFVAAETTETITLSSLGANVTNPQMQLYSGTTCAVLNSLACGATSITSSGLTVGSTYYIRVANLGSSPSGIAGGANFNICVTHTPPANDECTGAISLTERSSCLNTFGTLVGATYTTISPIGCGTTNRNDVWYSFQATALSAVITLSSAPANPRIQVFSGSCGSLTSIFCGNASVTATGLTIGNTYYVRIYTDPNVLTGTFNICITEPPIVSLVETSKSYVNITKLGTGGTVEPGDILEIRATFVVKGGVVDSVAYLDTLESNGGLILVPDSIVIRTNEGKVYKAFTDLQDGDAGWYSVSGADTTIQINIGSGSTASKRGTVTFLDRPRVYSSATIIMATYRVQVYEGYDGKINWGGGGFTYKDRTTGVMKSVPFKNDSLVVYVSPGLCSSTLSALNQVGLETNGTFGTSVNPSPLARNRGTSTAIPSYTYAIFRAAANGPQDYFYGVANNTSATYSIINTLPKAPATPQRVFNLWDIIGDHTGAANTARGNIPCDTTKPVSATNPCGYMLVVNAAYKTDTAFRSNITGLCPNTYYEISAWVRNICSKCGCDSTGLGASSVGFIPFATNDSSGIPPNIAFQLNGQDYYQTGNLYYLGTGPGITQQASDTVNAWVKRGFVYKTGPAETGFELLLRNNAPGGGGNDWAIDDIVVATCSPDVTVTPGPNPFVCDSNTVDVGAIISSYYDNYTYYKWEKSTDNGVTWASTGITGGPMTPSWNGSAWAYNVSYPTFIAYGVDSGSQYRVVIASTASNLSSPTCSFSGNARVTLTVDGCGSLLDVDILSFKGKNENNAATLYFTTSKEQEPVKYEIQKSKDASSFTTIGEITGYRDPSAETNRYTYVDPELLDNTLSWYRIKAIKTQDNKSKYSKVVQLIGDKAGLQIESLINPFNSHVKFDLISGDNGMAQVEIFDQYQHKLKMGSYNLVKGRNRINIDNTDKLPAGFYILRVTSNDNVINRKIIKRG